MPPEVRGPEGFKEQTRAYRTAFPDPWFSIESLVAEDDEVMVRWTAAGTHRNSMAGEAPTGKRIEVSGFGSWRISNGNVAAHWGVIDSMSLLRQMGPLV